MKSIVYFLLLFFISSSIFSQTPHQVQAADAELNKVYKELRSHLTEQKKAELKKSQLDWIKRRDAFANNNPGQRQAALYQSTVQRVDELKKMLLHEAVPSGDGAENWGEPWQKNLLSQTSEPEQTSLVVAPQLGTENIALAAVYLQKPDAIITLHFNTAYDSDIVVWERKSGNRLRSLNIDQGAEFLFPAQGKIGCVWVLARSFSGAPSKIWLIDVNCGKVLETYEDAFDFHAQRLTQKIGITDDTFWYLGEEGKNLCISAPSRQITSDEVELPSGVDGFSIEAVYALSQGRYLIRRHSGAVLIFQKFSFTDGRNEITIAPVTPEIRESARVIIEKSGYLTFQDSDSLLSDYAGIVLNRLENGDICLQSVGFNSSPVSIKTKFRESFTPTQVDYSYNTGRLICVSRDMFVAINLWELMITKSLKFPQSILSNPLLTTTAAQCFVTVINPDITISKQDEREYTDRFEYQNKWLSDFQRLRFGINEKWQSLNLSDKIINEKYRNAYESFLKTDSYESDLDNKGFLHAIPWSSADPTQCYKLAGTLQGISENGQNFAFTSGNQTNIWRLDTASLNQCVAEVGANAGIDAQKMHVCSIFGYPKDRNNLLQIGVSSRGIFRLDSSVIEYFLSLEEGGYGAGPHITDYDESQGRFVCIFNSKYSGKIFSGDTRGKSLSVLSGGAEWTTTGFSSRGQIYVASRDRIRTLSQDLKTKSEWRRPGVFHQDNNQSKWAGINRWSPRMSNDRIAYASGSEGIYILNLNASGDWTIASRIFILGTNSVAAVTEEGFFSFAGKVYSQLAFSKGAKSFPFEQFDLRLNRPDIVLERLGAPAEAIAIAKQLREKRLKRMGVTEDMLQPDFHLPEIDIVGDLPSSTAESELALKIKASDSKYPLDRLRLYVNNVPVNGKEGELLRDSKSQTLERTISIKLAAGRNKIQVSVLNSAGAESLYANVEVTCTAQRSKPTLYAVAMGVSEYAKPEWNLKYAAKDATDFLERVKSRSGSSYGKVNELLLTDREVTKESLGKIRDFLYRATVDDTVLMFVAGHGLLDSKYDYYFGTSDIDFDTPSGKGIAFEEFDDLLAELPCLKKSLLIDTCHAGELDEDEKKILASATGTSAPLPTGQGIAVRSVGTRGMSVKPIEGARGKSEWYDRLQGLFVDLRRGSGSTILSSSAGAEYALESSEQKNGLFTYAVLEALDGKEGSDTNKDGSVTMSELADYVKTRVAALTNNKQAPNVRRVNLEADFALSQK